MSFLELRSRRYNNVLDAPAVVISTQAATSVGATSATGNGTLTNSGESTVTAMGFVWNTSPNPTLANNVVVVSNTVGAYTGSLTGLPSGTTIYYDAYVTNASGTTYGGDQSFTTSGGATTFVSHMAMMGIG